MFVIFSLIMFSVSVVFLVHTKKETIKKVQKKKRQIHTKVTDDQIKFLERIEKRLDELHEKVEHLNDRHREVLGLFEDHLVKHHKKAVVPQQPPPKSSLSSYYTFSTQEDSIPGPHPEALHPEGPPENMSLGDDQGELGPKTGLEPLKTTTPKTRTKKCPRCGSDVDIDWVKCPSCSGKL